MSDRLRSTDPVTGPQRLVRAGVAAELAELVGALEGNRITPDPAEEETCWCYWQSGAAQSHSDYAREEGFPPHEAFSDWEQALAEYGDDPEYDGLFMGIVDVPSPPADDFVTRINQALAEVDRVQADWKAEREDCEGFVTWRGIPRRDVRLLRRP